MGKNNAETKPSEAKEKPNYLVISLVSFKLIVLGLKVPRSSIFQDSMHHVFWHIGSLQNHSLRLWIVYEAYLNIDPSSPNYSSRNGIYLIAYYLPIFLSL